MAISTRNSIPAVKPACSTCRLRELCLPIGLDKDDLGRLDTLINRRQRVRAGQHIYRAGNPFHFLYAIRSGFFKAYVLDNEGREQINGFHMSGELMGLDAIGDNTHTTHAIALEDSEVCEIPFPSLEDLIREVPTLQHQFHKIMSREIAKDHHVIKLLGGMTAEQRLTVFLLNLSARFQALGFSPTDIHLKMSREEIGNYLSLKIETVSRTLSKLQAGKFIQIDRRRVVIQDLDKLKRLIDIGSCGH